MSLNTRTSFEEQGQSVAHYTDTVGRLTTGKLAMTDVLHNLQNSGMHAHMYGTASVPSPMLVHALGADTCPRTSNPAVRTTC